MWLSPKPTPVVFRRWSGGIVAILPLIPEGPDGEMLAFDGAGRRTAVPIGWYQTTKEAAPADCAPLLAILRAPSHSYVIIPHRRITSQMRVLFMKECVRLGLNTDAAY